MNKAAIFDLDGTLADTLEDLAHSANHALEQNGFRARPLDCYRTYVGNGVRKMIERALRAQQADLPENVDTVLNDFLPVYDGACLANVREYTGFSDVLRTLSERGYQLSVVTNKPQKQAKRICNFLFPDRFVSVYGLVEGRKGKPDPEFVRRAMQDMDADESSTFFIGDSNVDMLTAKAADLPGIGCCWGFRGAEELQAAGAKYLVNEPQEILNILS